MNTISLLLQPSSPATCIRALSTASLAGLPAQWPLEGLPDSSPDRSTLGNYSGPEVLVLYLKRP